MECQCMRVSACAAGQPAVVVRQQVHASPVLAPGSLALALALQDRATFINNFTSARREMKALLERRGKAAAGQPGDICTIM